MVMQKVSGGDGTLSPRVPQDSETVTSTLTSSSGMDEPGGDKGTAGLETVLVGTLGLRAAGVGTPGVMGKKPGVMRTWQTPGMETLRMMGTPGVMGTPGTMGTMEMGTPGMMKTPGMMGTLRMVGTPEVMKTPGMMGAMEMGTLGMMKTPGMGHRG